MTRAFASRLLLVAALLFATGALTSKAHAAGTLVVESGSPAVPTDEIDFGVLAKGKTSLPKWVDVRNTGPDPVTLSDVVLIGDVDPFDFMNGSCEPDLVLAVGATCDVGLEFAPLEERADYEAVLVVAGELEGEEAGVLVKGKVRSQRKILVDSVGLDFGSLPVGQVSPPKTLRLTNDGAEVLELGATYANGPFLIGSRCPHRLEAGDSCEISVAYQPGSYTTTSEGAVQHARLIVRDGRYPGELVSVPLGGTALMPNGQPFPSKEQLLATVKTQLTRVARPIPGLVRGGPKRTLMLPAFEVGTDGSIQLSLYGRVGKRWVSIAHDVTARVNKGAPISLSLSLNYDGQRLLRRPKPLRIRIDTRFRTGTMDGIDHPQTTYSKVRKPAKKRKQRKQTRSKRKRRATAALVVSR